MGLKSRVLRIVVVTVVLPHRTCLDSGQATGASLPVLPQRGTPPTHEYRSVQPWDGCEAAMTAAPAIAAPKDTSTMRRWWRQAYLAVMGAMTVLYFALPDAPRFIWTAIGCLSVAAIVVGVLVNRPRKALPWWLVAAGTATFIAGDTAYDVLTGPLGLQDPFPSVADVFYLCTYPLFAGGLLLLIRAQRRERDGEALVDALIITTGVGFVVWVFLASPYMRDGTMSAAEKGFSIAYPLGDVLLLAVLARLLIGGGAASLSLRLLTLGSFGLMVADVLYGLIQLGGFWQTGSPVDLGWIIFYVAWGAAALQPDMVQLTAPARLPPQVLSPRRLRLLGSVSLLPPLVLLLETVSHDPHDLVVNALATAVIFGLVIVRLGGLIHTARQSTQRESVLRRAGESLVGASSREEIYAASAQAIAAMTRTDEEPTVLMAMTVGDSLRLVYDSAGSVLDSSDAVTPDGQDLVARYGVELLEHYFVLTSSDHSGTMLEARLGQGVPVLIAALVRSNAVVGVVVVSGVKLERSDIIDAVCAMTAQMALALDSADLTEQVLQRKSEAQFRSLIQNTSDIILVVDADLRVSYQTPSMRTVLGHQPGSVIGRSVLNLVSSADTAPASVFLRRAGSTPAREQAPRSKPDDEWRLVDGSGQQRAFEVTCSNLFDDPSVRGLVLTLHEITERRALEERLKHLAFHDSLTQLPNRALFLDRVEHALARRGRHRERLAVMLIDLDDFKLINDTRGHAAGDALLVNVTKRIACALRPEDTCARLGGDEFAVLVEGLVGDDEAGQLAERILTSLQRPSGLGDDELTVRASIGLSTSDSGVDAAELLMQADLAMYAAKGAGKGTYELYRPSLQHELQSRLTKLRDLQRGMGDHQFLLHHQPILHLASGRVVGTEALLRWQHPEHGLVFPGAFIDAVEEGDLAVPLGRWVIETAIAQAATWQPPEGEAEPVRLSVNVAPRQLADPGFVDYVADALDLHGLPPAVLVLEITERTLTVQEPQIVSSMQRLSQLGVGLAVDDFGTGYAALGYLRRFPVTTLKIDRSFVSGVDTSTDDRALVAAIVRLGETLNLSLVAEGIETLAQRDALIALGCAQGQGFLYARALPPEELRAYISMQPAHDLGRSCAALTSPAQGAS